MKISYVTMQFPAPSETFATNEIRVLADSGHQISVHALRPRHRDHSAMLSGRDIKRVTVSHNTIASTLSGVVYAVKELKLLLETVRWLWSRAAENRADHLVGLFLLPRAFSILAEIENEGPDVVHLYWGHFPSIIGRLIQTRHPSIVTSIGLNAYDLARRFGGTIDVARQADLVKTQAKVNVEAISAFTGVAIESIAVIHNGVDLGRIDSLISGIEKEPFRIVTVGRLVAGKAMDDALRVFANVRQAVPRSELIVLGDGPERRSLENLASALGVADSVRFRGHVPHDDAIREMARAQCLLFLSKSERLPNVVKEAMACRCACITTVTPGIDELVTDNETGYLVEPGDIAESSAILESLMKGGDDLQAMTDAAYQHVVKNFDLAHTAQRLANLWQQAVLDKATANQPVDTTAYARGR